MRKLSLLSLFALVSSLIPSPSLALSTSYDVFNVPDMFLNAGITESATTGIYLAAPVRNGAKVTYPTTSGGLLKFEQNGREELVAYNSATVDATTKVITLAGVTRNVCFNLATAFTSCGNGKIFTKGASVRLVNAAQLFNLKANIDRANTFTARNAIRFSGSGSLGQPTFATTAIRDQQLGASPASGSGLVACVVATGLCYDGLGGAWVSRAAGSVQNADTGVSGKVEIPTLAHMQNLTGTGSSGAQNVVPLRWLVKNGTGSVSAGRVPTLNNLGKLHSSFLNATNSGVLVTRTGTGLVAARGTTSGQVLMVNSTMTPFFGTLSPKAYLLSGSMLTTNSIGFSGVTSNTTQALTTLRTIQIPANTFVAGDVLQLETRFRRTTCSASDDNGASTSNTVCGAVVAFGTASGALTWTPRRTSSNGTESMAGYNSITCTMQVLSVGANGTTKLQCSTHGPANSQNGTLSNFFTNTTALASGTIDTTSATNVLLRGYAVFTKESGNATGNAALTYESTNLYFLRR